MVPPPLMWRKRRPNQFLKPFKPQNLRLLCLVDQNRMGHLILSVMIIAPIFAAQTEQMAMSVT